MELIVAINVYWIGLDLYYDIKKYKEINQQEISDFVFVSDNFFFANVVVVRFKVVFFLQFIDCVFIGLYGIELLLVVCLIFKICYLSVNEKKRVE